MSRQLSLFGKPAKPKPYFNKVNTDYKKFINKKWEEMGHQFGTKEDFMAVACPEWNRIKESEEELRKYMESDATSLLPTHVRNPFFKIVPKSAHVTPVISKNVCSKQPAPTSTSTSQTPGQSFIPMPNPPTIQLSAPDGFTSVIDQEDFIRSSDQYATETMFSEFGFLRLEEFFTEDIINDKILSKVISALASHWRTYFDLIKSYQTFQPRNRKSLMSSTIERIQAKSAEIVKLLNEIADCKVGNKMTTNALTQTYLKKGEKIKLLMLLLSDISTLVQDRVLIKNLQTRIAENKRGKRLFEKYHLIADNGPLLHWDSVYQELINIQNCNNDCSPLDVHKMLAIADILSSNLLVTLTELDLSLKDIAHVRQIVKYMPVMFMRTENDAVLINFHEFVYTPGALDSLLSSHIDDSISGACTQEILSDEESHEVNADITISGIREHVGQPSVVSKFPSIVEITLDFVKQHGFSAHHRRRTETSNSSGVSVPEVRKHLYEKIPGLKDHGISESTVRRLFHAPNRNQNSSKRYTGLVDSKIGVKDNTYREFHQDAHYLFARNKQRRELAQYFAHDCNLISIDDMAKLKVGAPAVSRYHQIRKLFPTGDTPNLNDHDFPVPKYLLNVSGYMFLENIPSSGEENRYDHHSADMCRDEPSGSVAINTDFQIEEMDDSTSSLMSVFATQLNRHCSIQANENQLKEELKNEISDHKEFYELNFPGADASSIFEKVDSYHLSELKYGCTALANLLGSKVFVMNIESKKMEEIQGRQLKKRTSPIYIAYNTTGALFSLQFPREDQSKYKEVLTNLTSSMLMHDNLGRLHLHTPHTGPSSLFLRAQKFDGTTIATHVTDIINILSSDEVRGKRPILFISSDNGPDFSPISLLNAIFLYRMFKRMKLDFLTVFTYAARYSAYNCIEHLWAKMSNALSGVVLSPHVPGESKPPVAQTTLTPDALRAKEKVVFDNAMNEIENRHWNGLLYDGFEVEVNVIPCGEDDLIFKDYEVIKDFLKAPIRDMDKWADVRKEFLEMFQHMDRHLNEVSFVKCDDNSCCEPFKSSSFKEFLQSKSLKAPTASLNRDAHYKTFLEEEINPNPQYRSKGQPSLDNQLGACEFCPNYSFTSKTEKSRHIGMFHRRRKKPVTNAKPYPCITCKRRFSSQPSLSRHQKNANHTARDIRGPDLVHQQKRTAKRKETAAKRKRLGRQRLLAAAINFSSSSDSESEEEEEEEEIEGGEGEDEGHECISKVLNENTCGQCLGKFSKGSGDWLQCSQCTLWYHEKCF